MRLPGGRQKPPVRQNIPPEFGQHAALTDIFERNDRWSPEEGRVCVNAPLAKMFSLAVLLKEYCDASGFVAAQGPYVHPDWAAVRVPFLVESVPWGVSGP